MIKIVEFGKDFGNFTAVHDLSLTVDAGEILGLIGPNGSGKSTTLRFLATLLQPTRGDATINNYHVSTDPINVRRSIGFMPETFGVYPGMKVAEFLDFFAAAYSVAAKRRKHVIRGVLEKLDLVGVRNEYVNALSRGMKQRLCLAKNLLHDPPVLILDEPLSGLDPRFRARMIDLIRELSELGKAVIISSHILSEISEICTTIAILESGQLIAHGTIQELRKSVCPNRQLTISVANADDTEKAESIAQEFDEIITIEIANRDLIIEWDGDEQSLERLIAELVSQGVGLSGFVDDKPDLENLFEEYTSKSRPG